MINNSMYLYSFFIVVAIVILMGNLIRLMNCTRRSWAETKNNTERFKAAALFLLYVAITGVFVWCACASLCDIYCPFAEAFIEK